MKLASIFLAALLQLLPLSRVVTASVTIAPSTGALVSTWLAGAIALLGSYDAVSGASAGISGLTKYSGTTPVGTPTLDVAEPVGQSFRYRISVSNPGSDFDKNYFNCTPLPPGLTINTNVGAAGYLSGIPLQSGRYSVTLVAGNLSYPIPATAQAIITIYPANSPPVIETQPQDQSILIGSNAVLSAEVIGTPPIHFRWEQNELPLTDATNAFLSVTNVQSTDAGRYRLIASNQFGSVTSAVARLTIREPLTVELRLTGGGYGQGAFQFEAAGPVQTNYVIWCSSDLTRWLALSTNRVVDGLLRFSDSAVATEPRRFYRVSLSP
jgi:hypothetical protein